MLPWEIVIDEVAGLFMIALLIIFYDDPRTPKGRG